MKRILAFLAVFIIAAGCGKNEDKTPSRDTGTTAKVAAVSRVETRGEMVPNFSWTYTTGATDNFDSYKGAVTLVNFWATWCGPCKKELPDLVALSNELASKDIKIIGVSTDKGGNVAEKVQEFVGRYDIPYPIVISNDELEEAFGNVNALPTSFIVTRDGTIAETLIGLRSKEEFRERLTSYLQ